MTFFPLVRLVGRLSAVNYASSAGSKGQGYAQVYLGHPWGIKEKGTITSR